MIIVCFVQIFLMGMYGLLSKKMKIIEKDENCKKCRNEEIREIVEEENISISDGKFYGYNPRKQEIMILDKEFYGLYDMFAIYHEIGHYHDDMKNKRILKNMIFTGVNRILVIPIFFVLTILCWAKKDNMSIHYAFFGVASVAAILGMHRLYFIIRYEVSASKAAISKLACTVDMLSLNRTKKLACYAMLSQALLVLVCMITEGIMIESVFFISAN